MQHGEVIDAYYFLNHSLYQRKALFQTEQLVFMKSNLSLLIPVCPNFWTPSLHIGKKKNPHKIPIISRNSDKLFKYEVVRQSHFEKKPGIFKIGNEEN